MGSLLTLVLLSILALAILGMGIAPFISGVFNGGKKVSSNPVVAGFTNQAERMLLGFIQGSTSKPA